MMRRRSSAIALCALFLVAVFLGRESLRALYERASDMLAPNASREFAYGERHLDATDPNAYDLSLAEYFFRQALAHDPNMPYVYHELARIAFLRGDLDRALVLINIEIAEHGSATPNAYYVRGLIEGYTGRYADAERDYGIYLSHDSYDWAAMNDDAWILLKEKKYAQAAAITKQGLSSFPGNPWLLNSEATALYELGSYRTALSAIEEAQRSAATITADEWLHAYPGNAPQSASAGIASLKSAIAQNAQLIATTASSTVQ